MLRKIRRKEREKCQFVTDPIFHLMDEIDIKNVFPDGVYELASTVGHELTSLSVPVGVPARNPALERIRKLQNMWVRTRAIDIRNTY